MSAPEAATQIAVASASRHIQVLPSEAIAWVAFNPLVRHTLAERRGERISAVRILGRRARHTWHICHDLSKAETVTSRYKRSNA